MEIPAKPRPTESAAVENDHQRHLGSFELVDNHLLDSVLDVPAAVLNSNLPAAGLGRGDVALPKETPEAYHMPFGNRQDHGQRSRCQVSYGLANETDLIKSHAFDRARTKSPAVL